MKLKDAISIVLNEAEVSAMGNRDDTQLETLKAIELVREFYLRFGYFFDNFDEDIDMDDYMFIQKPPTDTPNE